MTAGPAAHGLLLLRERAHNHRGALSITEASRGRMSGRKKPVRMAKPVRSNEATESFDVEF